MHLLLALQLDVHLKIWALNLRIHKGKTRMFCHFLPETSSISYLSSENIHRKKFSSLFLDKIFLDKVSFVGGCLKIQL